MSEFLQLGEHISIQKGKPPLLIPFHGKGAEIYLSPEYLRNRTVGISAKASSDAVRVSDGATVLLWDGSNAGEFFKAKEGIVASTMARITPDENFYQAFFFHLLKHAERILKNQTNGTGIPHVDKEILENISAFCPSDSQQRKIAEVLDTLDTAIHQTEAIVEKLKQVKQGLLHDLLTRGVDANGELRPSYEQAPELYQASALGWIPKDWTPTPLSQILAEPMRNGLYKQSSFRGRGPLMVQMGGLFRGDSVDYGTASRVHVTGSELAQFGLAIGDLLFARRSLTFEGAGMCVVVRDLPEAATFESSIIRARLNSTKALPEFVNSYLRGERSSVQRRTFIRQVAVSGVSSADIAQFEIALPKTDEQQTIIDLYSAASERTTREEVALQKLQRQKVGLMDDLLTGRVRVTPLLAQ